MQNSSSVVECVRHAKLTKCCKSCMFTCRLIMFSCNAARHPREILFHAKRPYRPLQQQSHARPGGPPSARIGAGSVGPRRLNLRGSVAGSLVFVAHFLQDLTGTLLHPAWGTSAPSWWIAFQAISAPFRALRAIARCIFTTMQPDCALICRLVL